ncbi:hypothetical protein V8B55DRAFT_1109021 [Mucor lusitanicus]|uniref:Uncharacterized protein n=1 Tax=Mucor circinelloides f. lusitanicus TaxID=29924 RepID=A0A8H4B908_MUCCL|nr:hypothetical protein FB192DRAFT_1400323 [Mucor lusitanicus]
MKLAVLYLRYIIALLTSTQRNPQEPNWSSANNRANVNKINNPIKAVNEEAHTSLPNRYLKWQIINEVLLKSYEESYDLHGHADPCLAEPITLGTKPESCNCASRTTSWPINGFMMLRKYKEQKNTKCES